MSDYSKRLDAAFSAALDAFSSALPDAKATKSGMLAAISRQQRERETQLIAMASREISEATLGVVNAIANATSEGNNHVSICLPDGLDEALAKVIRKAGYRLEKIHGSEFVVSWA